MPFKSKAQRRTFAELLVKGEISPETFEEWNRDTGNADLPEHAPKKKPRKRAASAGKKSARKTPGKRASAAKRKSSPRKRSTASKSARKRSTVRKSTRKRSTGRKTARKSRRATRK